MVLDELKSIKSGSAELKKFGIVVGTVIVLIATFLLWREKSSYLYFYIVAAALILLGMLAPKILLPLQKAWMGLSVIMGFCMARVILFMIFYIVITPIGLAARLLRKDFLNLKMEKTAESYWIERDRTKFDRASVENQF